MKCLEAQHVFGNSLDKPVILLKDVVEIFNLQDFHHLARARDFQDRVYSLCTSQIGYVAKFLLFLRPVMITACHCGR